MTDKMSRLVRAGLLTGVTDGLFATVQSLLTPGSTVIRLWQGVASTVLGKSAYDGGVHQIGRASCRERVYACV